MNSSLREMLGLQPLDTKELTYSFAISTACKNSDREYVMQMGQVFAILVPKDRISAKYRGFELSVPATPPKQPITLTRSDSAAMRMYAELEADAECSTVSAWH